MTQSKFEKFFTQGVIFCLGLVLLFSSGCEDLNRQDVRFQTDGNSGFDFDDLDYVDLDDDLNFDDLDDDDLDFDDLVCTNKPRRHVNPGPNEGEIFYIKDEIKTCDEMIVLIQQEIDNPYTLSTQRINLVLQKQRFEELRKSWIELLDKKMYGGY